MEATEREEERAESKALLCVSINLCSTKGNLSLWLLMMCMCLKLAASPCFIYRLLFAGLISWDDLCLHTYKKQFKQLLESIEASM